MGGIKKPQNGMSNAQANKLMNEMIKKLKAEGCDHFSDRFNGPLNDKISPNFIKRGKPC